MMDGGEYSVPSSVVPVLEEEGKQLDHLLPISSEGISSTSPIEEDQWLNSNNSSSGFEEETEEEGMVPPATTSGGGGEGGVAGEKMGCTHLSKAVSMPGIRKAMKGDIRIECSKPSCETLTAKQWMCLQCGHIGCGDENALGGHAKIHIKTPRSDVHCIAVEMSPGFDRVRCLECQVDVDLNATCLKEPLPFLKRHQKIKSAMNQSSSLVASAPIALGPPPPPPIPKLEPVKPFTMKGKQSNRMGGASTSGYGRWGRDSGGKQWPLGLENLGNTCFMNSALQCLSRTRSLVDKLDLYGSGKTIEILVTNEHPWCVKMMNPNVTAEECDEHGERDRIFLSRSDSQGTDSEEGSGEISPSSAEMDSLLETASTRSSRKISESDGGPDTAERQLWKRELKQEVLKELQLRATVPRESMSFKLLRCFKALTRASEEDTYCTRSVYTPRAIQLAVSKQFRLGHQHDSHELLRTVVDMMKKDQIRAFRLAIMQAYGIKKTEAKNCDPKLQELMKMWDRKLCHKTFVDEIFGGELVTFQQCLDCKNVKRSHEEFLDLSLPIRVFRANPNPASKKTYSLFDDDYDYVTNRSVEECLRAYTAAELLTGSNAVECENCHQMNLERLTSGVPFEEIFPGITVGDQNTANSGKANKMSKHQLKKQNKTKRQSRQARLKTKCRQSEEFSGDVLNSKNELNLIEDHFMTDSKGEEKPHGSEDDSKSNKSSSLDGYVVVQNATTLQSNSYQLDAKTYGDMDYDSPADADETQPILMVQNEEQTNLSKGLSTSIKSLSLVNNGMDVEEGLGAQAEYGIMRSNDQNEELMDDLDEPAVDGIGNVSDVDEEEINRTRPLDLGLEEKPISVSDYLTIPSSSGGADEGFSEGENSSDEKRSPSLSGSSSQSSISETDNITDSSDKQTKKIPVTKCPCQRRQLISRAPECLTLHLKRFQHTARGSSKLNDSVTFPFILNLTEFCSEEGEDVMDPSFKTTFDEDGEVVYSLYGIVEHSGSLHFGHYVAYVKVAPKISSEQTEDCWFYISDSHVSQSTLPQVLHQDAYILFYERIRGPDKKLKLRQATNVQHDSSSGRSSFSVAYNKPSTTVSQPSWDENWEDSSQQVSSSNDRNEDMSITLNYETSGPVSSSTLYSSGPQLGVDGVSSTTFDGEGMDFATSCGNATTSANLSHPIWDGSEIHDGTALFGDLMDDDGHHSPTNPVSSSSDVIEPRTDGYTRLQEFD